MSSNLGIVTRSKTASLLGASSAAATRTGSLYDGRGCDAMSFFAICSAYSGPTDVTCKIQDSDDGIAWYDLVAFTAMTGTTTGEQKVPTRDARRFLRAVATLNGAGTFTVGVQMHHDRVGPKGATPRGQSS